MKATWITTLLCIFGAVLASTDDARSGDKTITKVVKLLQKMLDKSKEDAEADKNAYAKYKCYVDTNEAEKKDSIKKLTEQIELLQSKIAELQARNGELAQQSASLDKSMTENEAARKTAKEVRENSQAAFEDMVKDLEQGIGQMTEAVTVLKSIALNQQGSHKLNLLTLGAKVQASLDAASALLSPEGKKTMELILQGKKVEGDGITGILESLQKTFEGNLKSAQDMNDAEKKAFEESQKNLKDAHEKMEKSLNDKKDEMGENDGSLADSKTSLEEAIKQKEDDEDFLAKLLKMSAKKAKNYEERKMLRANEDAAIAEAISILNSDDAFETFGTVSATSTGATGASFLQLRSLRGGAASQQAETVLERAARQTHSIRLARVATGLRAGHAFTTVLDEIEKMKKTIAEEGEADKENLDWCKAERDNSEKDLEAKKAQIEDLDAAIEKLDTDINDPKTGLKVLIQEKEDALVENKKSQEEETTTRKQENAAYVKDVANLEDATDILQKAIKVLRRYYDQLDKHMSENEGTTNLLQKEDPKPPDTYGDFEGQSESGGKALEMLDFILKETKSEHEKAEEDEKKSQEDYDETMEKLKADEKDMQEALVELRENLTQAEKELVEKRTDLKDTTAAKVAIEAYLEKIKPGCDFITENFDLREENRATETKALEKAEGLIKDTPAYKDAVAKEEAAKNGKCNKECKLDTTSLGCKVCMEDTTKEDYCKANPGFLGCK